MASNIKEWGRQIRRGCAFLALTVCLQGLSPVMGAPSVAPLGGSASGVPLNTPWLTLRNAAKAKQVTVKVIGDGVTTTKVRVSLTNNGGNPIVVFIPANEVLLPGTTGIQKMMVLKNSAIKLAGGETRAFDLGTMCVSVKSIPPPGASPAEFAVDGFGDDQTWKQIASVVAAAAELDRKGAYKDLHLNPDNRRGQVTQLAIWRLLGQKSGKADDAVTPETIESDFWRAVGDKGKSDPGAVSKIPGVSIDSDGKLNVSDAQHKNIHDTYVQPIFDAIDLTVRASADPGLKNVAPLPSNSAFDTFLAAGERSYTNGDFVEASEVLTAATTEAEKFGEGDPRLSHALVSKGICLMDYGAYDPARTDLTRAKELREKVSGKQSVGVAECDNDLGVLNQRLEQYPVAENWFTQALGILDAAAQNNTPLLGSTLDNMGRNYNLQAQGDKAEPLLKRALAVAILTNEGAKSLSGNPDVAEIETNLAIAYTLIGNYADAQKLYEKALQQDTAALGADHPFIATILDGYADNLSKQNNPQAAEPYKKKAADIRSKAFGSNEKVVQAVAALPLGYDALTRIQLYSNGSKEVTSTMDKFMLEGENIKAPSIDKLRINGPIGDKWAVVIGISDFADKSINLKYAAKDAKDFATYLEKEANFAPDHVHVLLNGQATRKNILDQVADSFLPRVALKEDLVVIYLSSHGSPSKADVAGMNYLVAYDTNKDSLFSTGIAMDELTATIKKRIPAQRVIVVLDACHSGAVQAKGLFNVANFDADTIAAGSGQLVICSSKPNEVSWESKGHPNGVFTYHLLEALRHKQKLGDAFAEMEKNVRAEVQMDRNGEQQDPQLKSSWVGDDIILTIAPKDPRHGLPLALETDTAPVTPSVSSSKSAGGTTGKPVVKSTTTTMTVKKTTGK